jgi:choline-glycine betaine transporter
MDKSIEEPSRVVDAELVGHEAKPPLLKRILARLGVSLVLGIVGALTLLAGGLLTLSIVGAAVGLPLLLIGLLLLLSALLLPFAK